MKLSSTHIKKVKNHLRYRLYTRFNIRGYSAQKLQKMACLALLNATILRTKEDGKIELLTVFMGQKMKMVFCLENNLIFTAYK